jgi:hypothetical protein
MIRIIFYTSNDRNFRSTLLGYLYELQKLEDIEIILLTEKLDLSLLNLVSNKLFFPKIINIIPVCQYSSNFIYNPFIFNRFKNLASTICKTYKPNLIFVSSDFHSIFELLLCRFSKLTNAKIISIACSTSISSMNTTANWIRLYTIHTYYKNIYKHIAFSLYYLKMYCSHFLLYFILPILTGIRPFFGNSSYILHTGQSGMRDADFQIVFSNQEKNNFISSGVKSSKITIVRHPYSVLNTRELIKSLYPKNFKVIDFLILYPSELIGFNSNSLTLINENTRIEMNVNLLQCLVDLFPDANICFKFHPDISLDIMNSLQSIYLNISNKIKFLDSTLPIDLLLHNSNVVIDFPRPGSTSVFLCTVLNPDATAISANIFNEYWGANYKFNTSVKYADNFNSYKEILCNIKTKTNLQKDYYHDSFFDFHNIISFLNYKNLL